MPHAPDALPDALADDGDGFGAEGADLALELGHAGVHFLLAELGAVLGRARDDVGQPEFVEPR